MNIDPVSIVIPVHNEAATLPDVLTDLRREAPNPDLMGEIIVVDDGSTDGLSEAALAADPKLRLVHLAARSGSGQARRIGTLAATAPRVAWIDGDGIYRARDLWRLAGAMEDEDQVIGARAVDFGRLRLARLATKHLTCRLASRLWITPIPDLNSGIRIFRRAALLEILPELPNGFSCTTTATLAALNRGHCVRFLPVDYRPRLPGHKSKFQPLRDTFRLWRVVYRQWRQQNAATHPVPTRSAPPRPAAPHA